MISLNRFDASADYSILKVLYWLWNIPVFFVAAYEILTEQQSAINQTTGGRETNGFNFRGQKKGRNVQKIKKREVATVYSNNHKAALIFLFLVPLL